MGVYQFCGVFLALLAVTHGLWPFSNNEIPKLKLKSGGSIPMLGIGTFLMTNGSEAEAALDLALTLGYRYIDTATSYNSEKYVGNVLKRWLDSGKVKRKDLFILTKLPAFAMRAEDVAGEMQRSLENLQLEYVDMWLIHHSWATQRRAYDPDTGRLDMSNPALMDNTTDHIAIWKAMESEVRAGRAKGLGVANMNQTQIEEISRIATVPISDVQVETHLQFQEKEMLEFTQKRGIRMTAYSPLANPSLASTYPASKNYPDLLNMPVVKEIAARHGKSPAQILLRYTHQRGIVVIPKAVTPSHIRENRNIFNFKLCRAEMKQLAGLDKGLFNGKIFNFVENPWIVHHPTFPWPVFRTRV